MHKLFLYPVLLGLFIILPTASAEAVSCLNCGDSNREEKQTTTSESEKKAEAVVEKTSSRNTSKNIAKLDDDPVTNLFIPVLFSVALSDITNNFSDPRSGGRTHEGLDMLAPNGTPVLSPTNAVVLDTGHWTNAGYYVETANPGNEQFTYMHLDEIADIEKGELLQKGEVIGYVGDTGNAKGGPSHLHFELRRKGKLQNPFFRITKELTLEKKMQHLEDVLEENDATTFINFLVSEYESVFVYAQMNNVAIPSIIRKKLPEEVQEVALGTNDLEVGSEGIEVSALQSVLIMGGFLEIAEPTGYFGYLTKNALKEYQLKHAIYPASGKYGPLTRKAMSGTSYIAKKETISTPDSSDLSLEDLVRLFLAFGIIDASKEKQAYAALETLT